jgi:hypothetical protein
MQSRCVNRSLLVRFSWSHAWLALIWVFVGLIFACADILAVPVPSGSIYCDHSNRFSYRVWYFLGRFISEEHNEVSGRLVESIRIGGRVAVGLVRSHDDVCVSWIRSLTTSRTRLVSIDNLAPTAHFIRNEVGPAIVIGLSAYAHNISYAKDRIAEGELIRYSPAFSDGQECPQSRLDTPRETVNHYPRLAKILGDLRTQCTSVVNQGLIASKTSKSTSKKEPFFDRIDLTSRREVSRFGNVFVPLGIHGNGYLLAVAANDNNRSKTSAKHSQQQKAGKEQPLYMRISAGPSMGDSWPERTTGGVMSTAFPLWDRDVDVSFDGKTWFHLTGGFCARKLPPFAWDNQESTSNAAR